MTSALHTQQQWTLDGYGYPQPELDRNPYARADQEPRSPRRVDPNQHWGQQPAVAPNGSPQQAFSPASDRPKIDQGRFWVGAGLTAVVSGLAAVVGLVVARDLLHVQVLLSSIGLPGANIGSYGLVVAFVALMSAGVYNAMVAFAPRPAVYYGSLAALLTALAVLMPFATSVSLSAQVALAGINLVLGILIAVLVPVAATNARAQS